MSANAKKQKGKRGRPRKWRSPPPEDGSGQPQRVRNGNSNNHKVGHYAGALREVIDSAQEALSVYLLTEDPFPMDEVLRNDQCGVTESENPKRSIMWKKMIDGFFNAALEKNEDALMLGKSLLDLMLRSAEVVYTKIRCLRSQMLSVLPYVICFTDGYIFSNISLVDK